MLSVVKGGNVDRYASCKSIKLVKPPTWTSNVRAASVKLSKVDTLFVLQAKSYVSGEGSPYI